MNPGDQRATTAGSSCKLTHKNFEPQAMRPSSAGVAWKHVPSRREGGDLIARDLSSIVNLNLTNENFHPYFAKLSADTALGSCIASTRTSGKSCMYIYPSQSLIYSFQTPWN